MKAIIYTRVSTTEQANHGFSLASQEVACKKFAEKECWIVEKVFVEKGESAKTTDRTELQKLIKYCTENKKEPLVIIIWKMDRLSRNMQDHYALNALFDKLNIKVYSATENNDDTSVGKFTRNMLGAVSQFENDQKSERVTAGMKQAFIEGRWLWRAPVGYKAFNSNIIPDKNSAPYVRKIFELFETGLYQQTEIIAILAKDGFKINNNHVCRMLKNPLYCGLLVNKKYSDEPIKGAFEPIISEKTFYKVQAILQGNRPHIAPHLRQNPMFPLRQFITCPHCNQPLTGSNSMGRRGKKYPYYHCYCSDCSINFRIPKSRLEDKFVKYLKRIRPNKNILELFRAVIKDVYTSSTKEYAQSIKALEKRLVEVQACKSKLIDLYIDGKIQENDYKMKSEQFTVSEQTLKAEIITSDMPKDDFKNCLDYVCRVINNIDELWLHSELDTKQRLQKIIFPKGLSYDLDKFRTPEKSCLFTIIGALSAPNIKMVLPGEFESPPPP